MGAAQRGAKPPFLPSTKGTPPMAVVVETLALSHFRSHRRARLAFDGRPVALIGANGAGKTNLLEALSLLSPGRGLRRAAPEDLFRRPDAPGWQIAATLRRDDTPHEIETGALPGQPRSTRIDGKAMPQSALGRLLAMLWLTPAMDRLWIEAPEGRRRFLDRMALGFFPDHAEAALAYDRAMRERNRLLRDGVTDPAWFRAIEARMAQSGAQLGQFRRATLARLAPVLGRDGPFPAPALTLADDSPDTAEGLATALAEGRARDRAAGRSLTGPHRADLRGEWAARGLPADQCSTGEQKALLIATVLAHASALAADQGHAPILLLDEVAAHLDPERRDALHDAICQSGAQAFLTGTEAGLFTALGPRAQAFVLTEGPQGPDFQPVSLGPS